MAKLIELFCRAGLGMMLLCFVSCEQKQEPAVPPRQITVIEKSIDVSKRAVQANMSGVAEGASRKTGHRPVVKKGTEPASPAVLGPSAEIQAGKTQTHASAHAEHTKGSDEMRAVDNPVSLPAPSSAGQVQPKTDGAVKKELAEVASALANSFVVKKYDTMGRVDPFIPLLSEKTAAPPKVDPEEKKPKRILTPLEKMELSQLKLVAVVKMKRGYVAMVEERSGKGYEVVVGTYMGRNQGQVSKISREGILIKEYVKDFKGVRKERIQEIKFHKYEGGE